MAPPDSVEPSARDTLDDWVEVPGGSTAEALAGRYRLGAMVGQGTSSRVYAGTDTETGRDVAVKLLSLRAPELQRRFAREVSAVRLLDLPGVVRFLDHGAQDGQPYLVMERIEGAPFPGASGPDWGRFEPCLRALLETLDAVHAAGLVHRDIKPSNVLVTPDGRPVLLDFGLVCGDPVGSTITRQGSIMGTPLYLAPEQVTGARVDARADLYAVGAMAYEVLTGHPPHQADSLEALWNAKLLTPPEPLRRLRPDLPLQVTEAIDALLARHREARLPSARAALDALASPARRSASLLPWLGPRAPVDAVLEAVRGGAPLDVVGPEGSGRTRCLQEAAEGLKAAGVEVFWPAAAQRPFASLATLAEAPAEAASGEDAVAAAEQTLRHWLATGERAILVDDADGLDRWSAALLDEIGGPVVRASRAESEARPAVALDPLSADDLQALFHGPDRILHLREDAAAELHRRTGGRPGAIGAEVASWVRQGLARWDGGRLRLERRELDRLHAGLVGSAAGPTPADLGLGDDLATLVAWIQLAGDAATPGLLAAALDRPSWQLELELAELHRQGALPHAPPGSEGVLTTLVRSDMTAGWSPTRRQEAHATLAACAPPHSLVRVRHLLAAGALDALVSEVGAVAAALRARGEVGRALELLEEAASRLQAAGRSALPLLAPRLRAAVAAEDRSTLEALVAAADGAPAPVLALTEAVLASRSAEASAARAALDALPPFADPELEYVRQATRFHVAYRSFSTDEGALFDELHPWAVAQGDPDLSARVLGWEGLLRYRQGRFAEAAELAERSAARRTEDLGRTSALLNAAEAWIEAGALDRAEAAAVRARALAAATRASHYEARAEWIGRSVVAARGEAAPVDAELVASVEVLGDATLLSTVVCTECMLAWRAGDRPAVAALARRGLAGVGGRLSPGHPLDLYLRGMVAACAELAPEGLDALAAEAAVCPIPGLALDVLGLLAAAERLPPRAEGGWPAVAEALHGRVPPMHHRVARGALSPGDALAWVLQR